MSQQVILHTFICTLQVNSGQVIPNTYIRIYKYVNTYKIQQIFQPKTTPDVVVHTDVNKLQEICKP